jgi:hypothetical protein
MVERPMRVWADISCGYLTTFAIAPYWRRRDRPRALDNGGACLSWILILRPLAISAGTVLRRQAAIQSLLRKKIVEKNQSGYRLSVEMFRFWILKNQIGTDALRKEAPVTIYGHS